MELEATQMTPVINRIKRAHGQLAGVLRPIDVSVDEAKPARPTKRTRSGRQGR